MESPVIAFIGFGSNLGDPRKNVLRAFEELKSERGILQAERSPLYRSKAWGIENQADFANAAARIVTTLEPEELLARCLEIEERMGRLRRLKWGPRLIDLDILLFGKRVISSPHLSIPHPYLEQRPFVLQPLLDLDSALVHPSSGRPLLEILRSMPREPDDLVRFPDEEESNRD